VHKNLPSRHHAYLALQISIARFKGITLPGKWVIDSAQSFLALSWICELWQIPIDFDGEIPWILLGGDEILVNSGLFCNCFVAGKKSGKYFSSAVIPIQESEWQIN
jgi:hypothetical protein